MARSATKDTLEKFRFGVTWGDVTGINAANAQEAGTAFADIAAVSNISKAGFHDVQMPKRTTNKIQYREGNDPDIHSVSAGLSTMEDIVLSRGLMSGFETFKEMHAWSQLIHSTTDTTSSLVYDLDKVKKPTGNNDYRKEVWIWMYNRDGSIARAWKLFNAFPTNFVPGSDLNASEDGEKSLEQITLAYEDFMEVKVEAGSITSTSIFE